MAVNTKGFEVVRSNEKQIVIKQPNNDYKYINRSMFTTLENYVEANRDETPFYFDDNNKRVFNTIPFYLEYLNNFISVAGIAEHYGIEERHANLLINTGRNARNNAIKQNKI